MGADMLARRKPFRVETMDRARAHGHANGHAQHFHHDEIMTELHKAGVRVNLNPDTPLGQGVYGPGIRGEPGTLNVNLH